MMNVSICFIERRDRDSPSIERVFRTVADVLKDRGLSVRFAKVPYGNGFLGTLLNLLTFRPPNADIYHVTGHVNFIGLVLPRNRAVLTVHDLTILDQRSGIRRWLIEKIYFSWPIRRAKYLTAISQATRSKVEKTVGIPSSRIRVIENPLLVSRSEAGAFFNQSGPTILQIGTAPNKNVERLVDALTGIPCRLRIIGKLSDGLRDRIRRAGIEIDQSEGIDDADIERAYEEADIVTLCSTDEGFGLPIIEAQAKGTIVVTSDREPMRNVAGGGAFLVDPDDVGSLRSGLMRVIGDSELRRDLRAAGFGNIARFDPEVIGDKYLSLYRSILSENP